MRRWIPNIICLLVLVVPAVAVAAPTLTLRECLERGAKKNPLLKATRRDKGIAAATVRQSASPFYPRLDLQGGYTMQQAPQAVVINGRTAETQEADYGFVNAAVTYTLYDFGRRDARLRLSRANAEAVDYTVNAREQDVALQIIGSYFGILEAQRMVKAAEEEVVQVGEHKKIADSLFQQGMVTRNDVLQADVRLASARQKLLAAQNGRENLWLQLNYLTGSDAGFRADLDEQADLALPEGQPTDPRQALENRPELKSLRKSLAASEFELKESTSAFYPELFSKLALDYVQNDKVSEQTIMSATVGLKVNLFDGFATTAARQRAVETRTRAEETLRQVEAQTRLELTSATNDAQVARQRIAVTETAIQQSEENLRINRDRYQARVGTATDVLDAQTLLTQAKTEYFQALYDFQVASARVRRAMGEL